MTLHSLYNEHASWFHLLTRPEDYEEEAAVYLEMLKGGAPGPLRSILELGAGGGNNAWWYRREVPEVTLTDLSPQMLALSETINPECQHVPGDMRSLRLGRTFDAVFVHDAIGYLTREEDLAACFETAATHLPPGGVALFVPDDVTETFRASADHGGHDAADGSRGLRYLEWTWDPDPGDSTYEVDYAYVLRDGRVTTAAHDHHTEGLFPRATWVRLIESAGLEVVEARRLEWDEDANTQVAFLARKPEA